MTATAVNNPPAMPVADAARFVLGHGRPNAPRDDHFDQVVTQITTRAGTGDAYTAELLRAATRRLRDDKPLLAELARARKALTRRC